MYFAFENPVMSIQVVFIMNVFVNKCIVIKVKELHTT